MCGRFTLKTPASQLFEQLSLQLDPRPLGEFPPRFNICPTQSVIAVLGEDKELSTHWLRWGLVPFWADDLSIGSRMINARSETVSEKPSFRKPFAKQRCLIPADGYFEWHTTQVANKPKKQPYWIHLPEDKPFVFAGLWDSNTKATGKPVVTCTILTAAAAPEIATLHDRMPVLIAPADYETWLYSENQEEVERLIQHPNYNEAFGPHLWRYHPVSTAVNSPKCDAESNIEPIAKTDTDPNKNDTL
jgi:putative SOS response-associated peptidase YedK